MFGTTRIWTNDSVNLQTFLFHRSNRRLPTIVFGPLVRGVRAKREYLFLLHLLRVLMMSTLYSHPCHFHISHTRNYLTRMLRKTQLALRARTQVRERRWLSWKLLHRLWVKQTPHVFWLLHHRMLRWMWSWIVFTILSWSITSRLKHATDIPHLDSWQGVSMHPRVCHPWSWVMPCCTVT